MKYLFVFIALFALAIAKPYPQQFMQPPWPMVDPNFGNNFGSSNVAHASANANSFGSSNNEPFGYQEQFGYGHQFMQPSWPIIDPNNANNYGSSQVAHASANANSFNNVYHEPFGYQEQFGNFQPVYHQATIHRKVSHESAGYPISSFHEKPIRRPEANDFNGSQRKPSWQSIPSSDDRSEREPSEQPRELNGNGREPSEHNGNKREPSEEPVPSSDDSSEREPSDEPHELNGSDREPSEHNNSKREPSEDNGNKREPSEEPVPSSNDRSEREPSGQPHDFNGSKLEPSDFNGSHTFVTETKTVTNIEHGGNYNYATDKYNKPIGYDVPVQHYQPIHRQVQQLPPVYHKPIQYYPPVSYQQYPSYPNSNAMSWSSSSAW